MAYPRPENLRPSALLTNYSVGYSQSTEGKKAELMLPGTVPVKKRTDKYLKWDKGSILRSEAKERTRGTPSHFGEPRVSQENYDCIRYSVGRALTDEDFDDYESVAEAERAAVFWINEQKYLLMAKKFVEKLMTSTLWGTGVGGNANQTGAASASTNQFIQWDRAGGIPINDILEQQITLQTSIGREGNFLFVNPNVYKGLRRNAEIKTQLQYTQGEVPKAAALANLFDVERLVSIGATENTANEGQTATMALVLGKSALLGYFNPVPTKDSPACAKIFTFEQYGGFDGALPIFTWFDPKTRTWYYEADFYFDIKVTAPDAGVFFITAVQ